MAPGLAPTLALASGVPMALLGAALLLLQPRRSEQLFFGLFSVLWGLLVVAANLGLVLDSATVFRSAYLVHFALLPPATLFLAQFTARIHGGRWSWTLPVLAGGIAALAVVVLLARPGSVLAHVGATAGGGLGAVELGTAAFPLFFIPFFGVFYLALGALYVRYRAAEPGSPRHRFRGMLLALALYTSYQTVTNLIGFLGIRDPVPLPSRLGEVLSQGLFVAGTLLLVGIVAHLALRPPAPGDRDRALLAAFLVPATVALVTELWDVVPSAARTWGLWRLLMVAVLVHAIARDQLFDLDLRLKRWAAPGLATALVALAATIALVLGAQGRDALTIAGPILVGGAAAVVLVGSRERVGAAFFGSASEETSYIRRRKREVYEAALRRVVEDGDDPDADTVLSDLRASLEIPQEVHEALAFQLGAEDRPEPATDELAHVEPGATLVDRYHVDRLLGEGAHGRAFLAYDETEDRDVVLKVVGRPVLGGRAARLLVREAELLTELDHPNVIDVYDVLEGRHEVVLVLEHAAGGDLAGRLDRRGRLGRTDATRLLDEVLAGLAAAHDAGIVHRDVKPSNILFDEDGAVKLVDLGVARREDDAATALAGGPVGTLLYMSPEQVRGDAATPRSDLYAAAVVFHRALTGRFYLPTAGEDDFGIRQRILEDPPELDLGDQPAWVGELLSRALAKDPEDRFETAEAMRAAIGPDR